MKKILVTSLLLLLVNLGFAQQINPLIVEKDQVNQKKWVDSIYNNMSIQEKIG